MDFLTVLTLAFGLSMDSFTVSISNGFYYKQISLKWKWFNALIFAVLQGGMLIVGFLLGQAFTQYMESLDHYIAILLLSYIGIKMITDSIKESTNSKAENTVKTLNFKTLLLQGIATSIDALAIGVTFAAVSTGLSIYISGLIIGIITFVFSFFGLYIGKKAGMKLGNKAKILGGILLIGIGIKIFVEHMFF